MLLRTCSILFGWRIGPWSDQMVHVSPPGEQLVEVTDNHYESVLDCARVGRHWRDDASRV